MSFQQIFYTSCEEGLGARKGFQVKACSTEIPPVILEQVERLGLYERPLSTPARPTPEELRTFPVSLFFQTLNDGNAVLGQSKYIGLDYTNRPGNFFAHSLISNNSYKDFFQINRILPIETWLGNHWVSSESDGTEIPVVEKVSPGDKIEFLNIQPFLNESVNRQFLPAFLTAVIDSLKSNRRIIIVDDDENTAFWIAVASYALPYHMVLNLTFNTYVQNPYHNESLITGTTEDSSFNFAPHEIEHQYFVFDFKGNRFTKIEPDGFAAKCSFLYGQVNDEAIVGFPPFVEQVAPNLPTEELEDALSTYCYLENINLPDVNNINVLLWCSKYLEHLADKDFRGLFSRAVNERPIKNETLQACTDFYLAALGSEINPLLISQIENLYIQWLICEASLTADITTLTETKNKLPKHSYKGENLERLISEWLKTLKITNDSVHFITVLQIGDKLGFLEYENNTLLEWLGKNVAGKWITDSTVKHTLKEVCTQPGGINLLEGLGAFLAEQIDNSQLFSELTDLITEPACYRILSDYAVKKENLLLYIKLDSIKTNQLPEHSNRLQILIEQLENIRRDFHTNITSEIIQSSFNSVWLNQSPTITEANQLFLPPLREFVIQSEIPSILVDSLKFNINDFEESKQIKLIQTLSSEDVYQSLGEKRFLLDAHRIMIEIKSDSAELDGEQIKTYLTWVEKNYRYLSELAPILEENLAYSLFKVKNIKTHSKILLDCFNQNKISFLKAYSTKAETIIRGIKNQPEIARLLKTWIISAQKNELFLNTKFVEWAKLLLKNQSKKNIEKIEDSLIAEDVEAFDFWAVARESLEKDQEGFLKKMFGGIFNRQ